MRGGTVEECLRKCLGRAATRFTTIVNDSGGLGKASTRHPINSCAVSRSTRFQGDMAGSELCGA